MRQLKDIDALFTVRFMRSCSSFNSIAELFKHANINTKTCTDEELNEAVINNTDYDTREKFKSAAVGEFGDCSRSSLISP